MKKKLILLILVLPLFLMVSLFTATKTVSLTYKVPVSGIDIIGDSAVYLDLDTEETYKVDYAVYPTNAHNKKVTFSTESVEGFDLAGLEFIDGYIVPRSIGMAKVLVTTADGGYRDSFVVRVDSNRLQSMECTVEKSSLLVGDTVSISTTFKPANAQNLLLEYVSSNENVARVNNKGQITGVGRGSAVITATSKANPSIQEEILINVYQNEPLVIDRAEVKTWNHEGVIHISVRDSLDYTYTYKAYDAYGIELAADRFTASFDTSGKDTGHILLNYNCQDTAYTGAVRIEIFASYDGTVVSEECQVTFVREIELSFDQEIYDFFAGQNVMATFSVVPEGADVTYTYTTSNNNVQIITVSDGIVALYAGKAGVTELTIRATDAITGQFKEASVEIVVKPRSLIISESASTFGDENLLTVGAKEFDGSESRVQIGLSYKASEAGHGFADNLFFVTDHADVSVDQNGRIKISNGYTGSVKIRGVFRYKDIAYETAPFNVLCVGDGVNVRSFKELYYTVQAGKPVVLQADVVEDFGIIDGQPFYTESTVTKIHTTYDDTYYKNIGKQDEAVVKILLEFRNDLYGNGFTVNAGNVTMQLDGTGALKADALFRGPLNFVSMTESAVSAVSVKAQDNICFALYENVNVRNVKLYGCTLETDEDGNYDLADLDYVGTTVEVLGDNVGIWYTRIHNGRTVLRAFGDIDDPSKEIHLDISNSVLGGAREFILRIGSNLFVNCPKTEDSASYAPVSLPGDTVQSFPAQKRYEQMTDAERAAYEQRFIKTFVSVKNSVFTDAGIFAIGMDSHFSGVYLAQGRDIFKNGTYASFVSAWYDLAKTSYGAKLTFKGEVRMYNWKDVEEIDSSTLIEIVGESSFASQLEFNVRDMVKGIAENDSFQNIIYNEDGKQYVHAGIAFYGGGNNYSVFEFEDTAATQFTQLTGYQIGLDDVDKGFLASAAGKEEFYFLLHDSTAQFLPDTQEALLLSGDAYDCIYIKD